MYRLGGSRDGWTRPCNYVQRATRFESWHHCSFVSTERRGLGHTGKVTPKQKCASELLGEHFKSTHAHAPPLEFLVQEAWGRLLATGL